MADLPTPPNPWLAFLEWIEKVIKENWSGLAVWLYGYEEKKIDAAKQETQTAALKETLSENENSVLKSVAGKSDDTILHEFGAGSTSDDTDPK